MTVADLAIAASLYPKSKKSDALLSPSRKKKPRKPKVFLSYRRDGSSDWCGRLRDRLAPRLGENRVVMDQHSFKAGIDFKVQIREEMATCTHLLVLIRPQALKNARRKRSSAADFLAFEVQCALDFGVKIIPILAEPTMPALPKGLRGIADNHALTVRADPDFHTDVDRLLDHITGAPKQTQTRKKRK